MTEQVLSNFTHRLYTKLAANKHSNFFISPYSISVALTMCYIGARHETARQLRELLCVASLSDTQILELNQMFISNINEKLGSDVVISTANKIYQKIEAGKDFSEKCTKHFNSSIEKLDFSQSAQAAKTINKWVADQTRNKITDLISPGSLNDLTRMVLVNAIYFKGNWLSKFDEKATLKKDFHGIDGKTSQVMMMHLDGKKFSYISNPGGLPANTCIFPYVGSKVFMAVILPEEGKTLDEVETKLTPEILSSMFTTYTQPRAVNVQLPKFKLEHKQELKQPLVEMGAPLPFDESNADFSGIAPQLYISAVVHQAVVEVNEEGTEAAAATGVIMMTRCAPAPMARPIDFICNRPFMFVIYEQNHGTTLFIGKYVKPQ